MALAGLLALALPGCGNPCDALAEATCESVGEDAPRCQEARKRADGAGNAERAVCRKALEIFEASTR